MTVVLADEIDWLEQEERYRARFGARVRLFRADAHAPDYPGNVRTATRASAPVMRKRPRPTLGHRPPAPQPRAMTDEERIVADWDYPAGERTYRVVDGPPDVGAERAAEMTLRFVSADLGIERPRLFWLLSEPTMSHSDRRLTFRGRDMWGIAGREQHAIGLLASLTPPLIVQVTAHESLHLTQPVGLDEDAEERPAIAYGHKVRELLTVRIGGRERIAGVHFRNVCPRGRGAFAGAALGDVLIAPDERGLESVWRYVGQSWRNLGRLGS